MIAYHVTKSETVIVSGLVVLQMRFESDSTAMYALSPRGARWLARVLLEGADEADAWRAPDEGPEDEGVEAEALYVQGSTRVDEEPRPAPTPRRRKKRGRK